MAVVEAEIRAEEALAKMLHEYAGRWVAVRQQRVVADAPSLEELFEQIQAEKIEVERVFEVPVDEDAACFF